MKLYIILSGIVITAASCKKFLTVGPPKTEIVSEKVFSDPGAAISAMRGLYTMMTTDQSATNGYMELFTGISSDELTSLVTRPEREEFYINELTTTNPDLLSILWAPVYKYINNANNIILGVSNAEKLDADLKRQLEGEARFVRAFCHFYLVNIFGDIPYVTSTDYRDNASLSRQPVQEVYALILEDLLAAQQLLADDFSYSAGTRTQANRTTATALLARVYLYLERWEDAEAQASAVIAKSDIYMLEDSLQDVFLKESREVIWNMEPSVYIPNAFQGLLFNIYEPISRYTSGGVVLRETFYDSIEAEDDRKEKWTTPYMDGTTEYHFSSKYKAVGDVEPYLEYGVILRLAEQYLIRAEARAHLNNIGGAQDDLNEIRHRAGLGDTPANDQPSLLTAIARERQLELFTEGHRWFDIKRTGKVNEVMSAVKPYWEPEDALYPIPESERLVNPNLEQNDGY